MKCKSCGYNLGLEDRWCPHCGTKNEQAEKHNADMEKYSLEFAETVEEVKSNSRIFNAITVKGTIIAILSLLIAICIIVSANGYEIACKRAERDIYKNLSTYTEKLNELEKNRDVRGLVEYFDNNSLSYAELSYLSDYTSAVQVSRYYDSILDGIIRLTDESQQNSYFTKDKCVEKIEKNIGYIKQYVAPKNANIDNYDGLQGEYIRYVLTLTEDTLQEYFKLTDEEKTEIWDMNSGRRYVLLEEGLER